MFEYKKLDIGDELYNKNKDLKLETTYELCVNELGLQQSKRDQIIAFYIAVVSFVIPAIIEMDLNRYGKATGFISLFILGSLFVKVVVRYRIYKEVYWITCRTITQLYNFNQENITKTLVQHLFYTTMKKNIYTVIEFKDDEHKKIKHIASFRKILNSAETTIYEVLVLMVSFVLWIGIYILLNYSLIAIIVASLLALLNIVYRNIFYYRSLTKIYAVIIDGKDKSFNATYSKAWFLHGFYR